MTEQPPTCTTCIACLYEGYGYSNWTPEGDILYCLRGLNPALDGTDRYALDEDSGKMREVLDVALTCPSYQRGSPVMLDVDRDDIPYEGATLANYAGYCENEEIGALLRKHMESA